MIFEEYMIKGSCNFMGGISYSKSHPFFSFSHDLAISRDQRVEKQYRQEPLKVGHHAAKFCDHRHSGSEDTMVLLCHVISKNHKIKRSCDFLGRIPSRIVSTLPSLVTISTVKVEI